jgi:hypothetical protein
VSGGQLRRAFADHGLSIDLKLVAASPSLVGTVVAIEEANGSGIKALQGGSCITGGGGCPVGRRIPARYQGHAEITLGRAGKPGETYVASASAFARGEPLHCSGLDRVTAAEAEREIRSRGLTAVWRPYRDSANTLLDPQAVGRDFVIDADTIAENRIVVWVSPVTVADLHYPALERYLRALSRDC